MLTFSVFAESFLHAYVTAPTEAVPGILKFDVTIAICNSSKKRLRGASITFNALGIDMMKCGDLFQLKVLSTTRLS